MASAETTSIAEERPGMTAAEAEGSEERIAGSSRNIQRQVIGLFTANILTILAIGFSFAVYSNLLSPPEFGLYAVALSVATLLALILDGGLKTTIIKSETNLPREVESSIAVLMVLVSIGLILILLAVQHPILALRPEIRHDTKFVVLFVGIALLFYPFVTLPTAKLERELKYGHIAWIESLGTVIERVGPALFLLFTSAGIYSFVWALLISRLIRAAILATFHPISILAGSWAGFSNSLRHLREGAWIQAGTISSVARDNLHTLLVGPLFGKEWIGYYAWALQICLVSSQIFAQISARVSLPLLAQAGSFEKRWTQCLYQVRLLTMLTVPVLCGVWLILPTVNSNFFQGKWQPALALVPLLFLRMFPGMATTPLGPLIMVHRGGAAFGIANLLWTLLEVIGACALVSALGPSGLAWSYAFVVWIGLWLLMTSLHRNTGGLMRNLAREIVVRPSVIFAACATVALTMLARTFHLPARESWLVYVFASAMILGSYLLEPELRGFLIHGET
jgi:O-antigen/teichoic acid export membrane protein